MRIRTQWLSLLVLAFLLTASPARGADNVGNAAAAGISGSILPPETVIIGGSDGTDLRSLSTDATGKLNVNVSTITLPSADPCQDSAIAKSSVVLNNTATAQLIAAVSGQKIYVCGFIATLAGTSPTVEYEYGTGTTCGTGTTALTGTLAATVGTELQSAGSAATQFSAPASNALCVVLAGTAPSLQGYLSYVQQ